MLDRDRVSALIGIGDQSSRGQQVSAEAIPVHRLEGRRRADTADAMVGLLSYSSISELSVCIVS